MSEDLSPGYSRQEMMAIATGREIRDGELAIFGVGLSMLAGYFAKACHAPNVRVMTEGGVYGATPVGGLPWGIECNRISANATSFTSALDALGFLVASGRCDVGIIGAAQVDKFGNVNTTGIWEGEIGPRYRPPKTRLPGAGGANDIACGAKRFIIMAAHEKQALRRKSDLHQLARLSGGRRCALALRLPGRGAKRDRHDPGHSPPSSHYEGIRAGRVVSVLVRRGDQGEHRLGFEGGGGRTCRRRAHANRTRSSPQGR